MVTTLVLMGIVEVVVLVWLFWVHRMQRKIMQMSTAGMKALLDALGILHQEQLSVVQRQNVIDVLVRQTVDKTTMVEEVVKYLSNNLE